MADQEIAVPMDDGELFKSALADEPKQETAEGASETEQPRDEQGRFAHKEEQETAKEVKADPAKTEAVSTEPSDPKDEQDGKVPSWRAREIREARDAAVKRAEDAERNTFTIQRQMQDMERRLAELQKPKQEPIDIFTDTDAALKQRLSPFEARLEAISSQMVYRASLAEAVAEHGRPAIQEMKEALVKAHQSSDPDIPNLDRLMTQSEDPVGIAMQWFQRQKLVKETGGDLTAYKQRLLDEAMKDPAFQAKVIEATRAAQGQQQPGSRPAINLPPSLNKAPGTGSHAEPGDMSDASLFANAMRR